MPTVNERRTEYETHASWGSIADRTGCGNTGCGNYVCRRWLYRPERDIRRDEAKIAHDRWELRRALYYRNYAAASMSGERRSEYRHLNRDRHDSYWDRR